MSRASEGRHDADPRRLETGDERHHALPLLGIGQRRAHGTQVVRHVLRARRARNDGSDARIGEQVLEEDCAQLPAKRFAHSGMFLPRTARNSRPRPNGNAVSTPAPTSAASGRIRVSTLRSSSE